LTTVLEYLIVCCGVDIMGLEGVDFWLERWWHGSGIYVCHLGASDLGVHVDILDKRVNISVFITTLTTLYYCIVHRCILGDRRSHKLATGVMTRQKGVQYG
jgi:hypothetical protein